MFEPHARSGATPESVQRALKFSAEVSDLIDRYHPTSIPSAERNMAIAMASFMQSLDHRQAVILLIYHGARSSAAALVRPTFEAYFRGVWALKVATQEQIAEIFGDHPRIPSLERVLQQLKKNADTSTLAAFDSWKASGDYVHSGPAQISRWFAAGGIESLHSASDALDMLELTDFCGLLACIGMNEAIGRQPEELVDKLSEHTFRRVARRAVEVYHSPTNTAARESEMEMEGD